MEKKIIGYCGNCNSEIFEDTSYWTDSRYGGKYCSVDCSNESTKKNGYSYEDYQSWKP